jgi:hypothetical protein
MDPDLYREVLRKQTEVWDALIAAFGTTWDRLFEPWRAPEIESRSRMSSRT